MVDFLNEGVGAVAALQGKKGRSTSIQVGGMEKEERASGLSSITFLPLGGCNVGMEILKLFRSEALISAFLQDRLLIQSQLIQLATR